MRCVSPGECTAIVTPPTCSPSALLLSMGSGISSGSSLKSVDVSSSSGVLSPGYSWCGAASSVAWRSHTGGPLPYQRDYYTSANSNGLQGVKDPRGPGWHDFLACSEDFGVVSDPSGP
jgi:hypothetical protein